MDNWYYHRIIFECLTRNNLLDKELEPVKEEFFKILHHFKSLGKFEYSDTTSSCTTADCKFVECLGLGVGYIEEWYKKMELR